MISTNQGRYYQYSSEKKLCLYFGKKQNPCGCNTNCYHLEFDGDEESGKGYVYGCCQECQQDIYRLSGKEVNDMLNIGIWKPLVIEKEEENNMAKKTLVMEHSKYWFEYEEGKEYDFRVFRGNEDVTELVKNNVLCDLFYETLEVKEKHADIITQIQEMFGVDPAYHGEDAKWAVDRAIEIVRKAFGLPESRTLIYNGAEYREGDIVPAIHWQGTYSDVVEQMKDVTLGCIGEEFLELKSPDGKTRYIRPNWLIEKDHTNDLLNISLEERGD